MEKKEYDKLSGEVDSIIFKSSETGFCVLMLNSGSDLVTVLGLRQGSQSAVRLVETDGGLGDLSVPSREGGRVGKIQDRCGGLDIFKITESLVALRGTDEGAAESGRGYGEQT